LEHSLGQLCISLKVLNIIIITNIIEVVTIKMMLLIIITLPCNHSYKYYTFLSTHLFSQSIYIRCKYKNDSGTW